MFLTMHLKCGCECAFFMFGTEDFDIQINKASNSKGTMKSVQVTVSSQNCMVGESQHKLAHGRGSLLSTAILLICTRHVHSGLHHCEGFYLTSIPH